MQPSAHIAVLAYEGVFAATLMQARDFFYMAGLRHAHQQGLPRPALRISVISPDAQPVNSFSQATLAVDGGLQDADAIILPAFWGPFDALQERYPKLPGWLRNQHQRGSLICGEATGVFWMAAAGLLDGKEATTYWRFLNEFGERFPAVQLNRDKHLTDADRLYCASSVTSAGDLYLYLIEHFCGAPVAQGVARDILYETQRSYSPGRLGFGGQKLHQDTAILQAQQWLEQHYAGKFRIEDVARQHSMSTRNFMRRFQAATGDNPLHYLQRLRIETAKGLLSTSRKSIKAISYEVGYDDASFFARLFRQHTELSPNQYRRQFQHKE